MRIKQSYFKNLCIKDLNGNITESEKKLLSSWLLKSEDNKNEYDELKKTWDSMAPQKLEHEIEINREWETLNNSINNKLGDSDNSLNMFGKLRNTFFAPKLKPAFGIGAAILVIISSLLFFNNYKHEKILKSISTANNQQLSLELSDGSTVILNSGSEIQFYEEFEDDKRVVNLTGEAFFSVMKDERPFLILTNNATTKVLGTKFNVWARDNETRVVVKEGTVSLSESNVTSKNVILQKGETSKVIEAFAPSEPSIIDPMNLPLVG